MIKFALPPTQCFGFEWECDDEAVQTLSPRFGVNVEVTASEALAGSA